jgi:hypothetical protein
MNLSQTTKVYGVDDQSWLGSSHGTQSTRSITLDTSAFTEGTHYPDGYFKSGIPLAKIAGSELYGPYLGRANEVQLATITGVPTGGTFTLSFLYGESTGAIAWNATAAAVQAALEGMSSIDPGDVVVTGAAGGPYTITFGGKYIGENVPTLGAADSLTGGTSPEVLVTVPTAGDGTTGDLVGHLYCAVDAPTVNTQDVAASILWHGAIREARLPIAIDDAGKAAVAGRIYYD